MSLKRNIIASYASQFYVTLVGIIILPLYLKYMGAEAYGLVGFFAMLQVWFNLLDIGLTPTMARETARFRGGATDASSYRRLVRALEGVFVLIALIGGSIIFLLAGYIAQKWLKVSQLPITDVTMAVQLMAVIISLRWMCGLYRGAISGSEYFVWLGGYNSFIATLRFIGVIPILIYLGSTPVVFFSYQLAVNIIELLGLVIQAYRLLPSLPGNSRLPWSWDPLKPVIRFSLAIAYTTMVWVAFTQTDKLILSKLLPLSEYGYFTLAVLAASGIMIVNGPIGTTIMPRMAKLEAEGDHKGLIQTYRRSTQLVAIIAGAASVTLAFCAEPFLLVWTNDIILAHQAAPILRLYTIGNGILAVSAFPYYLQYAKGNLKLHVIGSSIFVVLLIPSIIWAVSHYGGIGAGYTWLILNMICFISWLPVIHNKFEPGLNVKWYFEDVLPIAVSAGAAALLVRGYLPRVTGRVESAGVGALVGLASLMAASLASSTARSFFRDRASRLLLRWRNGE